LPRPSKPVDVNSKHLTKEEYAIRKEHETKLKGNSDKIIPSDYLNDEQKEIFTRIVDEMSASGILSNVDVFLLDAFCVSIERLQWIDSHINRDPNQMLNKDVMSARRQHMDDFKRLSTELGFSPQSRAKLGNINLQKKQDDEDPLLAALKRVK
jgi:P27 family predicted phage terminase small subunit